MLRCAIVEAVLYRAQVNETGIRRAKNTAKVTSTQCMQNMATYQQV